MVAPISPITSNSNSNSNLDASQISAMTNSQISSMLASGSVDPKFAVMLLNQMNTNSVNSILFGDDNSDSNSSSSTSSSDIFSGVSSSSSALTSYGSTSNNTSAVSALTQSQSNPFAAEPTQFQMSVYSSVIGKTVLTVNPYTNEQVSGKVTSVINSNGQVELTINGKLIPAVYMKKIEQ